MSKYTRLEIESDNVNMDSDTINYLSNVVGCVWHSYDGKKNILNNNHIEYYKAFNHDYDKAIEVLRTLEHTIIPVENAVVIGVLYTENCGGLYYSICTYKGKIYLMSKDKYFGMEYGQYEYRIKNLMGVSESITYTDTGNEDKDIEYPKEVFEKYLEIIA